MNTKRPYRIIVTGGGTGGHIYPAIAVANKIKSQFPNAQLLFVGAKGRMEMQKVPAAGFDIIGLNIAGLQRRLTLKNLSFPFKVIGSYLAARKVLKEFLPDAVIGFGGYASAPVMFAASRLGIPAVIQEQNSYAGLTNKFLGKRVQKVCVAYEGMEKYFPKEKVVMTGNPVRQDIMNIAHKRENGLATYNLNPKKKTVLVMGGSLGARSINNVMANALKTITGVDDVQWLWQTGKLYYEEMKAKLETFSHDNISLQEFLNEMDYAYAVADVVVSRSGALTVSELSLATKPTVFVPSPNVAEDHQMKNAMALVNRDAALLVKDDEAGQTLISQALMLAQDISQQDKLKENIAALARPNAADDIVKELIDLIK